LHGTNQQQCVKILEKVFKRLTQAGQKDTDKEVFHIVVGRGKHNQQNTGVLKYVVAKWLDNGDFEFW
jgi:DNA-nicking Smr family endonuclease